MLFLWLQWLSSDMEIALDTSVRESIQITLIRHELHWHVCPPLMLGCRWNFYWQSLYVDLYSHILPMFDVGQRCNYIEGFVSDPCICFLYMIRYMGTSCIMHFNILIKEKNYYKWSYMRAIEIWEFNKLVIFDNTNYFPVFNNLATFD
jgi:hypothetical protein